MRLAKHECRRNQQLATVRFWSAEFVISNWCNYEQFHANRVFLRFKYRPVAPNNDFEIIQSSDAIRRKLNNFNFLPECQSINNTIKFTDELRTIYHGLLSCRSRMTPSVSQKFPRFRSSVDVVCSPYDSSRNYGKQFRCTPHP